jgi:isoleucyl-tRNA synthetase
LSPVDDVGKFTIEAGEQFVGMSVLSDGNQAIVDALAESGSLLKAEDYGHKYPYDWRTKKPTIFRATDQWFASVEGFRDDAMAAIETVSRKVGLPFVLYFNLFFDMYDDKTSYPS